MPNQTELPICKRKTTIGGQAIIEGITMKGPKKTCVVIRKPNGKLEIKERDTNNLQEKYPVLKLPVIRGAYSLFTALKDGFYDIEYSASFFEEETEDEKPSRFESWLESKIGSQKLEKIIMNFAMAFGIVIPVCLFMLLPSFISGLIPQAENEVLIRNIIESIVRISLFLIFMWSISHMKDIQRTFMYHGAEHKTIFCYEAELPLTVENVRKMPRFHPRCGTSFLFVLIIIATIVSCIVFSIVEISNPVLRALTHLVLLPFVVGISYEFNRYAGGHNNLACRILRYPGLMIQRLTVFEPDDSMIEVAIESMKRVIPNDDSDNW